MSNTFAGMVLRGRSGEAQVAMNTRSIREMRVWAAKNHDVTCESHSGEHSLLVRASPSGRL